MVNIVVLGDSIAYGIGSTNAETKSFGALVGEKVNGKVTNLGISGLDSTQLLEKLETDEFQNALKEADVVLMSIGSNDILKPFVNIVTEAVGVKDNSDKEVYEKIQKQFMKTAKEEPLEAINSLAKAILKVYASDEIEKGCQGFPDNFDAIIDKIHTLNSDALIYANNVYNPYYGVAYEYQGLTLLNVHEICELYVNEINKAFDRTSKDYTMIDMYSIFRQQGYTNVNQASVEDFSGFSFDPHPNDKGYQLMADYIYTQMDSIAPKVEVTLLADDVMKDEDNVSKNEENVTKNEDNDIKNQENGSNVNTEQVPVELDGFQLIFTEKVRPIEGKMICLAKSENYLSNLETDKAETDKADTQFNIADIEGWQYTLTGQEIVEETADGTYVVELKVNDFIKEEEVLDYDSDYELVMEEGSFKDKGNNSPDELTLVSFTTREEPKIDLEANSTAVVGSSGIPGGISVETGILAGIALVAVAIIGVILYNRKKKRKRERKTKE